MYRPDQIVDTVYGKRLEIYVAPTEELRNYFKECLTVCKDKYLYEETGPRFDAYWISVEDYYRIREYLKAKKGLN